MLLLLLQPPAAPTLSATGKDLGVADLGVVDLGVLLLLLLRALLRAAGGGVVASAGAEASPTLIIGERAERLLYRSLPLLLLLSGGVPVVLALWLRLQRKSKPKQAHQAVKDRMGCEQ